LACHVYIDGMKNTGTDRVTLKPAQAKGKWLVVDTKGRVHSSVPQTKAAAQKAADAINARLARWGVLKEG
jgi:hypothetical protein